jgi:enoyl-CoA hydratase
VQLATQLAAFPQRCLRADRLSSYRQWELSLTDALRAETEGGIAVLDEAREGAARFRERERATRKVE